MTLVAEQLVIGRFLLGNVAVPKQSAAVGANLQVAAKVHAPIGMAMTCVAPPIRDQYI